MALVCRLLAQRKIAISAYLLGLYCAQNFISRLPHGDQTRYKADKWKSLRYQQPLFQAHHTAHQHNIILPPGVRRVCAHEGRERGCSQDPEHPRPHPCRRCPQSWTPRRVEPATAHRVRNLQIYRRPPHLGVQGGRRCRAISRRLFCTRVMCASMFRGPSLSTRSSPVPRRAKTMNTTPKTFDCQTTLQS
jgi:hypothetical protein